MREPTTFDESSPVALSWTVDEAIAALRSDDIASVGGAPARIDESVVRPALAAANAKLLLLPFADRDARRTSYDQVSAVQEWAAEQEFELLSVTGLMASVSIFTVSPDELGGLQTNLLRQDVTRQARFAARYLVDRDAAQAEDTDTQVEVPVPADPELVAAVGDALAAEGFFRADGVADDVVAQGWDVGPDLRVRAAFLPSPGLDGGYPNLIGPLAQRFPDDVVVVVTGRWFDMAGPEPDLLRAALLYSYGAYTDFFLQYGEAPHRLLNGIASRIRALRTGVTTDQPSPETADPVGGVSGVLPWLFSGTAAVLVGGSWLLARRRNRMRRVAQAERDRADELQRDRLAGQVAALSARLLELEPLAREDEDRRLVDTALQALAEARDLLAARGDPDDAERSLARARQALIGVGAAATSGSGR
ncbi:hypothetical protein [Nakamurella leprariae]|uniref:Uncharacterized protein n=1 Tax=Nakamurella leprariae TaxID=2803911 RepID=A0A939C2R9_9ACTN|nr:hypothetical protein [Nakamurella leprariae]MBM9468387.1 hypothetical protein [Nakamurella leprariae]